jgi:hypothetical protein
MKTLLVLALTAASLSGVEVVNHHPFAIHQPITVGSETVMADVGGNQTASAASPGGPALLTAVAERDGLRLTYRGQDAGRLTWDLELKQDAAFAALALTFKAARPTPLYTDWVASATRNGFAVTVTARVYPAGFLDTKVAVRNASATQTYGAYAAAVARWELAGIAPRQLCYDNRIEALDAKGASRFSVGEGRHWSLQHGMDWLSASIGGAGALLMSSYSESPTVLEETGTRGPRFTGLNIPQFKNEIRAAAGELYWIVELARDNRPYRDRFSESRYPDRGQTLVNEGQVIFESAPPSRERADEQFLAYNSYASRTGDRIEIGVPYTTFGTAYFPYSTLGENFGKLKLPGQEVDAFWPLSADTVTDWRKYADDIRRDLRIAKAMGFTVIRLHYLDVISKLPEATQFEYLDFLVGEIRRLGLRAIFSTAFPYWTPEQIAARVARYRDAIDRVEIENEVLIWGIPLDRPQYWSRIVAEVKRVAPKVPVHWTAHVNTGVFGRMEQMKLPQEVVAAHAYIDGLDAIPSARGFALAVGQYARRAEKPAIYTEWNWRFLTRMAPEERAKVYPGVFDGLLATRSIAELYQFQFQETMCVNPETNRAIRHYEPLWLSRRPKPEAFELMKLMDRYAAPSTPNRMLGADHPVVENGGVARFHLENRTDREIALRIAVEAPPGVTAKLAQPEVRVAAHGSAEVAVDLSTAAGALPGFYHVFLRIEGEGLLRYAWAEFRKTGQPQGATIDLNRAVNVVYAKDAPDPIVQAAYMLALTVESASGRPVGLYSEEDLPKDGKAVLRVSDYEQTVSQVLAYWKYAKDSGVRKSGIVEKKLAAGPGTVDIPQ